MRYFLKSCLLAALLLGFSYRLPAQRFVSGGSFNSINGGGAGYGGIGGYGYGNYGWNDYGWGYNFGGWGFGDTYLHHPEEHPPFSVGFAHGDPDFVQSTFMDYNKAVDLGNKVLQEQAAPPPSLGEIARQLRLRARKYVPPPAPQSRAVISSPEKFVVIQDNKGTPILCRDSYTACRNAA